MKRCENCGFVSEETGAICPSCGGYPLVVREVEEAFDPFNLPEELFGCDHCGHTWLRFPGEDDCPRCHGGALGIFPMPKE